MSVAFDAHEQAEEHSLLRTTSRCTTENGRRIGCRIHTLARPDADTVLEFPHTVSSKMRPKKGAQMSPALSAR